MGPGLNTGWVVSHRAYISVKSPLWKVFHVIFLNIYYKIIPKSGGSRPPNPQDWRLDHQFIGQLKTNVKFVARIRNRRRRSRDQGPSTCVGLNSSRTASIRQEEEDDDYLQEEEGEEGAEEDDGRTFSSRISHIQVGDDRNNARCKP